MAPKKGAPKVKAEPKKRARTEPKHEDVPEDLDTSSLDKLALQKQLNSALRYMGKIDTPETVQAKRAALEAYLHGQPEAKNDALSHYAQDKSLKWLGGWIKSIDEKNVVKETSIKGWMSEEEIMGLKKVSTNHPQYQQLWSALKETLVERDHQEAAWAALGMKQWFYSHNGHQEVEASSSSSTQVTGKAAGKGHMQLLDGPEVNIVVRNQEWNACNAQYKVHKSGHDRLGLVAKEMGRQIAQLKHTGQAAVVVDKINDFLKAVREFQEEMDVQTVAFESVAKDDVPTLRQLSEKFEVLKNMAEAIPSNPNRSTKYKLSTLKCWRSL
jgi:hypothetical protein